MTRKNGTSRRLLLDTVAAIALLEGSLNIETVLPDGERASIPVIALGELYAGAEYSARADANTKRIRDFASNCDLIPCDEGTARVYARIVVGLRKKGRPIPQNDAWIAALAMQHQMTLLTRDQHFDYVDDLQQQRW